jgi:hypothetical protein
MRSSQKLAALIFMGSSVAALAQSDAEVVTRDAAGLMVQANGHMVTLPMPAWIASGTDGDDLSDQVQVFRQIMPGGELVEVIAADGAFDSWQHMTAAFVMDREAFPLDMHIKLLVAAFEQNCEEDKLRFQVLEPAVENGEPVALLVCAAFSADNTQTGEGLGEVMAVTIVQSPAATARIYAEWRGPAFDADKSDTWPVPDIADLRNTIARLSSSAAIVLADPE